MVETKIVKHSYAQAEIDKPKPGSNRQPPRRDRDRRKPKLVSNRTITPPQNQQKTEERYREQRTEGREESTKKKKLK